MLRPDRRAAILERVAHEGSIDVARVAAELAVSAATLRRDLKALQDQGLLVRTHGGAVSSGRDLELPLRHREVRQQIEKRAIGRLAASLVDHGAIVGMTGGTTALEVARALPDEARTTVVTNALNIAAELMLRPSLHVVVVGGVARHASYELVGPVAEATLQRYHLDIAFIGVDGLIVQEGCSTYDELEGHTDHAFITRAKRVVIVADSSKLGKRTFARICGTSEISDLVTDTNADPHILTCLRDAGVNVLTATV